MEDHDIGLHRGEVELDTPQPGKTFRQQPRVGMVLGKPVEIMVERLEPGGGEDARLSHRATKHPAGAMGPRDVVGAARKNTADRAAQPLRQRDRDQIKGCGEFGEAMPGSDRRIEQPRAVEVAPDAEILRRRADGDGVLLREDDAAAAVVGVLDRDQPRWREDDMPAAA